MTASCYLQAVSQEDGSDLDPNNMLAHGPGFKQGRVGKDLQNLSNEPPELHSIHDATVMSIKPYGVFVQMDGFRVNGLVQDVTVRVASPEYVFVGTATGTPRSCIWQRGGVESAIDT